MDEHRHKLATGLAWIGLISMTTLVLIRAMVEHDAFPWWQSDPFVFSPPVIGLTPTKALILNLAVVMSCTLALIGFILRRDSLGKWTSPLMIVGIAIIAYHGITTFESVSPGSNLLAIVSVLIAASLAHKLVGAHRLIGAITLGFPVLLVFIGGYEVFVVHPQTIANYAQTRDSFLAARGWTPGSFEALAYERRLYQPEPIAWFGLTNVFASFTGAGAAGLFTLAWGARRLEGHRLVSPCCFFAGLLALAGLGLSGAKGGIGAFVLGLGLTVLAMSFRRRKLEGGALVGLCGLVVLGVIARGLIGERIGELSLLFRSQYIVGSLRMWLDHLLVGVGPGAFQEYYSIYKPTLSPEDVANAHSVAFDLLAKLGVGGIAIVGVFISILWRSRPDSPASTEESLIPNRQLIELSMLIIAISSVVSIRFGAPGMDSNLLLIQIFASFAWASMALVIVRVPELGASLRWGLLASASVLAIHAMIEVSATWMVSGILWALMVSIASTGSPQDQPRSKSSLLFSAMLVITMIGAIGIFGARLRVVSSWEQELSLAAEPAIEISRLRSLLDELEHADSPRQLQSQLASELGQLVGSTVDDSMDQIISVLNQSEFDSRQSAGEHLLKAVKIRPTHTPTRIAATQQLLWRASVLSSIGKSTESTLLWDQAIALMESGTERHPSTSGSQWLGNLYAARARQFPEDPLVDLWRSRAQQAWTLAADGSPHNPHLALKLMDIAIARHHPEQARTWAKRALELNTQSRLDPLRGLQESDLNRVLAIARSSKP